MIRIASPTISMLAALALAPALAGCGGEATATRPTPSTPPKMIVASKPLATRHGERITLADLEDALLEVAGREVLREYALDLALQREAARAGISMSAAMLARERRLLVESLSGDPDRAERLLVELRDARGLGPVRFDRLLTRSALLRAMVAEEVEVSEDLARATWDAQHGPRRVARVIAVEDLRSAQDLQAKLDAGADFAELAATRSLDRSAPRGGLLAPVSREDPAWPLAFRTTLFNTGFGETSSPILVDGRYLVIRVEREEPASGVSFEDGREEALQTARLAAERLLMDRLARRLVVDDDLDVINRSIRWRDDE